MWVAATGAANREKIRRVKQPRHKYSLDFYSKKPVAIENEGQSKCERRAQSLLWAVHALHFLTGEERQLSMCDPDPIAGTLLLF
jgi:hypothetical protein